MVELLRRWKDQYFSNPQVFILGFLLIAGFLLIYFLGNMLTPVFAGVVIAYLLEGIVVRLQSYKLPRNVAVIMTFSVFLTLLLLIIIWLLPMLSRRIGQLLQELPAMVASGQKQLMHLPEKYPDVVSRDQIDEMINYLASGLTSLGQSIFTLSVASVKGVITIIIYLVLVPLLVFFFLKDKSLILAWVKDHLPGNRRLATDVWNEVNTQITNYIRGKIWEIIIVWTVTYFVLNLFDLKYTMLLSAFVGLSVLIPYIGATVMVIPIGLIAFFQWGLSPKLTYILITYGIIQLLDGNLLAPLLLSEVVNLHPVAIIVAVLVFGGLWGMWGLFFAIPLATLFHAVIKAWRSASIGEIETRAEKIVT